MSAGLHVLLNLPAAVDDRMLEREALATGLRVEALARYTIQDRGKRGLLLGYGRMHETAIPRRSPNSVSSSPLAHERQRDRGAERLAVLARRM